MKTTDFLMEEREWLNARFRDKNYDEVTKEELVKEATIFAAFYPAIESSMYVPKKCLGMQELLNLEMQELLQELHEFAQNLFNKISRVSDEDWEKIKKEMPFVIAFSALDERPDEADEAIAEAV